MRFSSLFTLLCSIAALVLSLLVLFAGSSRSFLQSGDLLTLNTSRIGQGDAFNTTDGDGGFFDNLINGAQDEANDLISDAADKAAEALNLTDFYSVHIMNYCKGYFEPNATEDDASKNTTFCSSRKAMFHFNPTRIVEDSLPDNVGLSDINWPDEIRNASRAIRLASIVMFVFYVIGIICAGLAVITAVLSTFTEGRLSALANFLMDIMGFFTLGIASAISTAVMVKVVHAVNRYGDAIGLAADKGATFLGLTWGATAAMLLAACLSTVQCIAGRKHQRGYGEKEYR